MHVRIHASVVVAVMLTAPVSAQEVVSFTLIDASTDQEIRLLQDGGRINFKTEGGALNIRADVRGDVESV